MNRDEIVASNAALRDKYQKECNDSSLMSFFGGFIAGSVVATLMRDKE